MAHYGIVFENGEAVFWFGFLGSFLGLSHRNQILVMGGWQLEVAKMAMYITFPVALFHYFNQPEYFEKWVTEMKRELYPPEDTSQNEEFKKAIRSVRVAKEKEILKALEDIERKEKTSA